MSDYNKDYLKELAAKRDKDTTQYNERLENAINENSLQSKAKFKNFIKTYYLMIIATILAFGGLIILFKISTEPQPIDYKLKAFTYSKELVKDQLKSPSSADFPFYDKSFVKEYNGKYTVKAYVDAENSFGATVRVDYEAQITFNETQPSGTVKLYE